MLGAEEGRAPFGAWCQDRGPVPSCVGAGCCGHTPAVPEALLSPQLACTGWQKPGCWRGPAARCSWAGGRACTAPLHLPLGLDDGKSVKRGFQAR